MFCVLPILPWWQCWGWLQTRMTIEMKAKVNAVKVECYVKNPLKVFFKLGSSSIFPFLRLYQSLNKQSHYLSSFLLQFMENDHPDPIILCDRVPGLGFNFFNYCFSAFLESSSSLISKISLRYPEYSVFWLLYAHGFNSLVMLFLRLFSLNFSSILSISLSYTFVNSSFTQNI